MSLSRLSSSEAGSPSRGSSITLARAVLRGESSAFSPSEAISLLSSSNHPLRHREFELVLADASAQARLRYLAAHALGRSEATLAQPILVAAAGTDQPLVASGIARALGRVGDAAADDALERIVARFDGRVRHHAEFARLLIAHRHAELSGRAPPVGAFKPVAAVADDVRPVRFREALPRNAERCLTSLGVLPYGIELAETPMFEFECDRCGGMILMNREYAQVGERAAKLLAARPVILGMGALLDAVENRYSPAALVLSTPNAGAVVLRVYLTNGTLVFAGKLTTGASIASWSLEAVERLGAFPLRASGTFEAGELHIDHAISSARVVQKRRPTPMG